MSDAIYECSPSAITTLGRCDHTNHGAATVQRNGNSYRGSCRAVLRLKGPEYVALATAAYREAVDKVGADTC